MDFGVGTRITEGGISVCTCMRKKKKERGALNLRRANLNV